MGGVCVCVCAIQTTAKQMFIPDIYQDGQISNKKCAIIVQIFPIEHIFDVSQQFNVI